MITEGKKEYKAEYDIMGLLLPIILFILGIAGGYYFSMIEWYNVALYLYLLAFSAMVALFVVSARLWGYKEAARRLSKMAEEERKLKMIKESMRKEESKEVE
ncbi:MAG: hypothetical protein ACTSX9_08300 [Candidatus Njordarchaeales archaeon]